MKKGEPRTDKKVDKQRLFAASAIRMLPDLEIESSKSRGDRAALVRD